MGTTLGFVENQACVKPLRGAGKASCQQNRRPGSVFALFLVLYSALYVLAPSPHKPQPHPDRSGLLAGAHAFKPCLGRHTLADCQPIWLSSSPPALPWQRRSPKIVIDFLPHLEGSAVMVHPRARCQSPRRTDNQVTYCHRIVGLSSPQRSCPDLNSSRGRRSCSQMPP